MKYGYHYDELTPLAKINAVRKSACNCFACATIQNGKLLGVAGNVMQQAFYFREEFKPKSGTFLFIPITCFVQLSPRLLPENNVAH